MKLKSCRCCSGSGKELDNKAVGQEMRSLRVRAKLSQTEVALRMEFSSAYISQLEQGQRDWSNELVKSYRGACE